MGSYKDSTNMSSEIEAWLGFLIKALIKSKIEFNLKFIYYAFIYFVLVFHLKNIIVHCPEVQI